jgi:hypothetical protein
MRARARGGHFIRMSPLLILGGPMLFTGCSTFVHVRSAEVSPGRTVDAVLTYAPPPGDAAAWFWSFECASDCDRAIPGAAAGVRYGFVPSDGGPAFEVGGGVSGLIPYAEGYAQILRGRHPLGLGVRLGLLGSRHEEVLYARYDLVISRDVRILLNPALYWTATGGSRGTRGSFAALAPGVGLTLGDDQGFSTILSLAYIHARSSRYPDLDYGGLSRPTSSFYVAGVTLSFD